MWFIVVETEVGGGTEGTGMSLLETGVEIS